jgi:hypothetical protein
MFAPPTRYAFKLANQPGKYFMLADNASGSTLAVLSYDQGGGCQAFATSGVGYPTSAVVEITMPAGPPGKPPYHPEIQ